MRKVRSQPIPRMRITYRVEYYDKEDKCWCNADQALCPEDFPSFEAAVGFVKWHRQFNYGKLRILQHNTETFVLETD